MSRSMILEAMYEVIRESTEWGLGEKDYGQFVDGVVAVVEKMLEKNELIYKERLDALKKCRMIGIDKEDA